VVTTPLIIRKLYPKHVKFGVRSDKKDIYLTFDDGPAPGITDFVLDSLSAFNAKASFFLLGKNIQNEPELFFRCINEGHTVGNHTYNHLNGWKTPNDEYFRDIYKFEKLLEGLLIDKSAFYQSKIFRPPYGKMTFSQVYHLKNIFNIYLWSVISRDFNRSVSPEKCLRNVIRNASNGSIIVFHDSIKASNNLFFALPRTLEYFSENGFSFKAL
jgi:peptidoglycan/xylan/chitin deacetylase (PgdA/CDA1 family)